MPAQRAGRGALPHRAHQAQKQGLTAMPPETSNSTTPRLLIVDDDAAQRSLLDSFLSSQVFSTVAGASGERPWQALREQKISIIAYDGRFSGISRLAP